MATNAFVKQNKQQTMSYGQFGSNPGPGMSQVRKHLLDSPFSQSEEPQQPLGPFADYVHSIPAEAPCFRKPCPSLYSTVRSQNEFPPKIVVRSQHRHGHQLPSCKFPLDHSRSVMALDKIASQSRNVSEHMMTPHPRLTAALEPRPLEVSRPAATHNA